jgi:hypothetical protein
LSSAAVAASAPPGPLTKPKLFDLDGEPLRSADKVVHLVKVRVPKNPVCAGPSGMFVYSWAAEAETFRTSQPVGWAVTPRMCTRRVAICIMDCYVQPTQRHRVEVEEVGREQSGRLCPQKRPPARVHLSWGGAHPAGGEDAADGASTDSVTEADQLALDTPDAPNPGSPGPADGQGHAVRR